MRTRWTSAWKAAVVLSACLCAFYVTVSRHGGLFGVGGARALQAQPRGAAHTRDPNYALADMRVLRYVLLEINNSYVDPTRVHPRDMLLKGLDAIQRNVAQVLVQHEDNSPTVTVRVDTHERTFTIGDVRAPWDLEPRWREIFTFLQQHLRDSDVDLRDVEYIATNGMLHTLDPHSVALNPEQFHEMQIQTGGHFGGLGIVISIRDGLLTIMNPMAGTPAEQAGLRRYDRIVKIGEESTTNMSLTEAVNRLRGRENTPVSIWVTRAGAGGWVQPRRFDLVRAVINVRSVEHRLLSNNIGWVRIKSFSETTGRELTRAVAEMRRQGMRGLVMDLRNNPGGLLEQAVEVADLFLSSGVIVVTAGNRSEGREEREARAEDTEPDYPMAVLVDGASASASEIVAGALKNNNRAIIIGQTSFGKGSVQTVRSLPDGGALKITIAQYLTPGDVSIQGTGITPDIELDPMTADALDMDLDADRIYPREADLSAHLTNTRARADQRASEVLQFYFPADEREQLRLRGADDLSDDGYREDFPIRFARDLVAAAPRPGRREELQDARPLIDRTRAEQVALVARALQPLRINWEEGPDGGAPNLQVETSLSRPDGVAVPGQPLDLTVRVTNRGTTPVFRLRATTKSDNPLFQNRELVFGRVDPGETRSWTTPLGICEYEGYRPGSSSLPAPGTRKVCLVPLPSLSRTDGIRLEWSELHNRRPANVDPTRVSVRGLERPVFAYGWQVAEQHRAGSGNGDGRVQRGEQLAMYLTIRNVGRGRSYSTRANLRNLSGEGVLLHDARFTIDNLEPGQERRVAFTFDVGQGYRERDVRLEFAIQDEDLREAATQKVRIPIEAAAPAVASASGTLAPVGPLELRESASPTARVIARAEATALFPITAQSGEWVRLDLGGGRPGWALRSAGGPPHAGRALFAPAMHNSPPMIESDGAATLAVRGPSFVLHGTSSDENRVLDLYIFAGSRKVFYLSNRNGADPRRMPFEATIPLRPGANIVTVVAREDDDVLARRVYVVRRDGPGGELLATPQHGEDDLGDSDD
ncbi:MAG: PDZ domain-containing protein [Deltaproteobacteria bacterium]|nr:PDZ domain-containing protein [Deltaproteobacteria bacterium]